MKKLTLLIGFITLCFSANAQIASLKFTAGANHFMGFNNALKQIPPRSNSTFRSGANFNFHSELAFKITDKTWINLQYGRGDISFANRNGDLNTEIKGSSYGSSYPLAYRLYLIGLNYELLKKDDFTLRGNVAIGLQQNILTSFKQAELDNNLWDKNRGRNETLNFNHATSNFAVQLGISGLFNLSDWIGVCIDANFFGLPYLPGTIEYRPFSYTTTPHTLSHFQLNGGLVFYISKADTPTSESTPPTP